MRPLRLALLAALLGGLIAAVVYRGALEAQLRALAVLSSTAEIPVLTWAVEVVTDEPRVEEAQVAHVPATIVRPGAPPPWPAIVFVNGATPLGRHHPRVQRLARGLARVGFLVVVPDVPGLRRGEITVQTLEATVAVADAVAAWRDSGRRVGFIGVSVGATLALLAAETPSLASRVSLVAGIAPYTDLRNVIRLATTGTYRSAQGVVRYDADSFVALAVGRSLAAALPAGRARRVLVSRLRAVDDDAEDPLAVVRSGRARRLGRSARSLVELLANRDPRRFERLYAALPASLKAAVVRLSPRRAAGRIQAPVELASAPHDKYFPLDESRAVLQAVPDARLTVTTTLEHAIPEPSLRDLRDIARFDAFIVRSLRKARAA